ncbi:hypothetical protein M917_2438 [Psychrobacter aquaticus CMS 56]|uniref:Uncharacterized protein n=1 Tax=Psychrobacter aquaticus CMS 56 TaxID=1354303 RepID=U4T2C9_9GAMM|nr:hypothetical protein M917_2438 [Psychrobacter aquaticus CMS 56]
MRSYDQNIDPKKALLSVQNHKKTAIVLMINKRSYFSTKLLI